MFEYIWCPKGCILHVEGGCCKAQWRNSGFEHCDDMLDTYVTQNYKTRRSSLTGKLILKPSTSAHRVQREGALAPMPVMA